MRTATLTAALLLCLSLPATAQEMPLVNLFAGFSYLSVDAGVEREDALGVSADLNLNLTPEVGLFFNFSYHEALDIDAAAYEEVGGVRYFMRSPNSNATFFVHGMGGGVDVEGLSSWAVGGGAGLDLNIMHDLIDIRVFQVDYLATFFADDVQSNILIKGGLVFKLGER